MNTNRFTKIVILTAIISIAGFASVYSLPARNLPDVPLIEISSRNIVAGILTFENSKNKTAAILEEARIVEPDYICRGESTLEKAKKDAANSTAVVSPKKPTKKSTKSEERVYCFNGLAKNTTYIAWVQFNIDLSGMQGIGSSIFIRGPAPHPDENIVNSFQKRKRGFIRRRKKDIKLPRMKPLFLYHNSQTEASV